MPDIVISASVGRSWPWLFTELLRASGRFSLSAPPNKAPACVRLVYGMSGALLGLCFGAFFIWLLLGRYSLGRLHRRRASAARREHICDSMTPTTLPAGSPANPTADVRLIGDRSLARLKNSVELGPVGDVVKKTDVVPTGATKP